MTHQGYIKLWRKSIDGGWLTNHKLWTFWCWCLMKASYKEYDLVVGCQRVHLMPGDFVFGLNNASEELEISVRSIRTILDFLKNSQNVTIKTTNKFSIISIVKWDTYQSDETVNDKQNDKPLTSYRQATDNKQEGKELKKVKNTNIGVFILPDWIPKETWDAFVEMRKLIKKPMTNKAVTLMIHKLEKLKNTGQSINEVLNQSILNNWQDVYELRGDNGRNAGHFRSADRKTTEFSDEAWDSINKAKQLEREWLTKKAAKDKANNINQ